MSDISKITLPNNVEYDLKDAKARKISNIVSLLDLIDNGYFGLGVINQRGQSTYSLSNSAYGIDRWKSGSESVDLTLGDDGITLAAGSTSATMRQDVPFNVLAGKTVTYSILYEGGLATGTGTVPTSVSSAANIITLNGSVPNGAYCRLRLYTAPVIRAEIGQTAGNSLKFIAAKLELGDTQTLAHQENGVWVLNELPNPMRELLKCQRYYLPLSQFSAGVPIYRDTDSIYWPVSIPITMENTTNLNLIGTPKVYNVSNNNEITGFTFEIQSSGSNVVIIKGTKTAHGATTPRLELTDCAFSTEI